MKNYSSKEKPSSSKELDPVENADDEVDLVSGTSKTREYKQRVESSAQTFDSPDQSNVSPRETTGSEGLRPTINPGREKQHSKGVFGDWVTLIPREESSPKAEIEKGIFIGNSAERYLDLGRIGEGGNAEVRKVLDRELNRLLAMKILRTDIPVTPVRLQRFVEEAQLTSQLNHPGIIPIHDMGTLPDGRLYFTMPIVQGETFLDVCMDLHAAAIDGDWKPTRGGWRFRRLINAYKTVCITIAYAHKRGVVHRDLKPQNIMLGQHGEVLVLDWGIAKVLGDKHSLIADSETEPSPHGNMLSPTPKHTQVGSVIGTPMYMAPEQALGQQDRVGAHTDVYALGAILYQILCGEAPFTGVSPLASLKRASTGDALPIAMYAAKVRPPEELVKIQQKAMSVNIADRYENALQLAHAIGDWLDGTQREAQALLLVDEYYETEKEIDSMVDQQNSLKQEAVALLSTIPEWAQESEKSHAWQRENLAIDLQKMIDSKRFNAERVLRMALMQAPSLTAVHRALAQFYRKEHETAEAKGDGHRAARAELHLKVHTEKLGTDTPEKTRFEQYLQSSGKLSFETDPPDCDILLCEYKLNNRRLTATVIKHLGRPPLTGVSIPMGSAQLIIRKSGYRETLYPIQVNRMEHWDGVSPGSDAVQVIRIPLEGDLTEEDCYVPAGWFSCGGDPVIPTALKKRRLWLDGFIMKKFPTRNCEYLEFLNSLRNSNREDEAMLHVPRERAGTEGKLGAILYDYDEETGFSLDRAQAEKNKELDWPVTSIDWHSAMAYADWYADKTQKSWRLPHELEWEKAARGVDGRIFPWGNSLDPSWCCMRQSHPNKPSACSVYEFPIDEGPFGVRGQSGNVRDWCINRYHPEIPWGDGERVEWNLEDEIGDSETSKVVRGGSWISFEGNCRVAFRFIASPDFHGNDGGFRLVRPYPSLDEDASYNQTSAGP